MSTSSERPVLPSPTYSDGSAMSSDASQTRCRRCLEWNNGDPWYCPRCGRETTLTPHDGGTLGDAAEWTRSVGWDGGWVNRADGTPIVNGTPLRSWQPEVIHFNGGPLAHVVLMLWSSGWFDEKNKMTAREAARRLYPWLVSVGWTPPPHESAWPGDVTPSQADRQPDAPLSTDSAPSRSSGAGRAADPNGPLQPVANPFGSGPTSDAPQAAPHVLIVGDEFDEDGYMHVEHPPDCPTEVHEHYTSYECHVGIEISGNGLDMHFRHRDDPEKWPYAEVLDPGRYEIEPWVERHPAGPWGPEEWSGGLRTVTPPQTDSQPTSPLSAPTAHKDSAS